MRNFILMMLLTLSFALYGQRSKDIVNVCGEYTYNAPSTVAPEQAKRTAVERAKLQALADEFGTVVSSSNSIMMKVENGQTDSKMISLGGSDVKGEWLEDTEIDVQYVGFENDMMVWKAKVCGKARAVEYSHTELLVKTLRNGTIPDLPRKNFGTTTTSIFCFALHKMDMSLSIW